MQTSDPDQDPLITHFTHRLTRVVEALCADPVGHASVLAGGRAAFRVAVARAARGWPWSDDVTDRLWRVLQREWAARMPGQRPAAWLDGLQADPRPAPPPDPRQVTDWEITSASSEAGRRWLYGDLPPQVWWQRLVAEDAAREPSDG